MRRWTSWALPAGGAGLLLAALAGVALAATTAPVGGQSFSGSGGNDLNRTSAWKRSGTAHFSFRTSSDGKRILSFLGTYSYYCGTGGSTTVQATYLTLGSGGRFNYPFNVRSKGGIVYVRIYGSLQTGGGHAKVSYMIDYVGKGQRVRHPYDTSHPASLGCATWVQGTAVAVPPTPEVAYKGCSRHAIKPTGITIACATGQFYVTNLSYSSYGGATASATGQLHLDNCKPDCARGTFHTYPGAITLSKLAACDGFEYYDEISWRYTGSAPSGARTGTQSIAPEACSKP